MLKFLTLNIKFTTTKENEMNIKELKEKIKNLPDGIFKTDRSFEVKRICRK